MGFLDRLKDQASGLKEKAVDVTTKNSDKITGGIDRAGELIDQRTKGKYADKIEQGKAKAKQGLDKLESKNAGTETAAPPPPPPSASGDVSTPPPPPVSSQTPASAPPPPSDDPDATPPPLS